MNKGKPHSAPLPAHQGVLIVVSSPSGGGKTTIVNAVRKNMGLEYSVSTTTRPPRAGERNGVHYNFVSKEEFLMYIKEGRFLEWAEVHGHLYGTDREYIGNKLAEGKSVLLDIDVQGAMNLRRKLPGALLIFIAPPSVEALEKRLRGRGADSEESIRARLSQADFEISRSEFYDYKVVNEDLETAIAEVEKIIKDKISAKQENTT